MHLWLVYIYIFFLKSPVKQDLNAWPLSFKPRNIPLNPNSSDDGIEIRHSTPLRLNSSNAPGLVQSDGDWSERKAAVTGRGLECKSVERNWEVRTHALGQDRLSLHWGLGGRQRVMFNHGRLMSCLYFSNCIGHRRRTEWCHSLSPSVSVALSLSCFSLYVQLCIIFHTNIWVPDIKEHISLVWFLMTWMGP